ncbi:MAG: AMP-binding protein [Gammaproteobacteria bacterium]
MVYVALKREVDALAGFLQRRCAVERSDRVLLYTQNSPQFVIGYYAILRADALVVPINPMNLAEESPPLRPGLGRLRDRLDAGALEAY